jgi:hypothetical protein
VTWVTEFEDGLEFVVNLDGVSWMDAPAPPRQHECVAQTRGAFGGAFGHKVVERCACGGIRVADDGRWIERNHKGPAGPRPPWWGRLFHLR